MRFSFNWLKKYLRTDLSIQEISDKLTSIGLEVESVEDPEVIFKNFKLVQIKDAQKHPASDHLKICIVEDAKGNALNIVCGAKNARTGLKTILAMPDAIIPSTKEALKRSKIRGVVSEGMMCSCEELGIASKNDGIIELDPDVDLSTSVGDALSYDGGLLDISITPNRGDCFSVRGVARDLAAANVGDFISRDTGVCDSSFEFPMNIHYENSDSCRRYAPAIAFRVIRGIKNGESPQWLKTLLHAAGINSISAIVDLSNLWMIERGRPLHIYDMNKIKGDVYIRFVKNREIFEDIKGVEHRLLPDMLIAADEESPLCLLGVMGGKKTACDENTTDILVESGFFDPIFVSKTGTLLNLTSDSRTRFERGIDKASCISELHGVSKLILETCGGKASEIILLGEEPIEEKKITLHKNKLDLVSGCDINWNDARNVLLKLGLNELKAIENKSTFLIPSWRSDLNIEEDLIEEVLRIIGYANVAPISIDNTSAGRDKLIEKRHQITSLKRLLVSRGLSELVTYSFTQQKYAEAFANGKELISLINPISADFRVMRPSLLPTLLINAKMLLSYNKTNVGICEFGNIFHGACEQEFFISGIRLGNIQDRNWLDKCRSVDIFDVKGDLLSVITHCKIDEKKLTTEASAPSYYHPSRSGTILLGRKTLGYFGELHPKINKLFDITGRIMCFEIFSDQLPFSKTKTSFSTNKIFPKISRDFAFLFPSTASVGNIVNAVFQLDPLITNVSIFDCFDFNITQKSIGISVTLEAFDRTLTETEAQVISDRVIEYVEGLGGKLRQKVS